MRFVDNEARRGAEALDDGLAVEVAATCRDFLSANL
jgi:hypothetical protein